MCHSSLCPDPKLRLFKLMGDDKEGLDLGISSPAWETPKFFIIVKLCVSNHWYILRLKTIPNMCSLRWQQWPRTNGNDLLIKHN